MDNSDYRNAKHPVTRRVKDLMGRMTLNQKIRQLAGIRISGLPEAEAVKDGIGGVNMIFIDETPREMAAQIQECQRRIRAATPFGIPAIFHGEALTGPLQPGCAAFPASLNMGAAFSPELVKDLAERTRSQLLNLGIRHALSPVFDLARDFRFGRTNEHYSSDPALTAALACAFVAGLQGEDLRHGAAATGKHFIGYSFAEGGLHLARVQTDWRDLRENFAKPFEAAIRTANLRSVMNAYSEYNGVPLCASKEMLTGMLREDLGFQGLVVSDYSSLDMLVDVTKTAENPVEAGIQAITAGLDMEFPDPYGFDAGLREAVKAGRLDAAYIDRALERVLTLKFDLGLFDEGDREFIEIDNRDHHRQSAVAAEKSITLTKNEGILPLQNRNARIALIGPIGNSLLLYNGTYTFFSRFESERMISLGSRPTMEGVKDRAGAAVRSGDRAAGEAAAAAETGALIRREHPGAQTLYEALRELFPAVEYAPGCGVTGEDESGFAEALELAGRADAVIMAVGGKNGWNHTCTSGEGIDSANITLPGRQEALIRRVYAVNPAMVIAHTDNKPLAGPWMYEQVPAIVEGWLPGVYGGNALARVIAGLVNPGGKLPVDAPRSVGQQPVYYYQRRGCRSDQASPHQSGAAAGINRVSQLPFGHGLSYTRFEYSGGALSAQTGEDGIPVITLSVTVTNTGAAPGDEVVQLYGVDEAASVVRPQKELVGFKRITLNPGESTAVRFVFRLDQLAFIDSQGQWVLERGAFSFFIGKGANDPVYTGAYYLEQTLAVDYRKRGFYADAQTAPPWA